MHKTFVTSHSTMASCEPTHRVQSSKLHKNIVMCAKKYHRPELCSVHFIGRRYMTLTSRVKYHQGLFLRASWAHSEYLPPIRSSISWYNGVGSLKHCFSIKFLEQAAVCLQWDMLLWLSISFFYGSQQLSKLDAKASLCPIWCTETIIIQ